MKDQPHNFATCKMASSNGSSPKPNNSSSIDHKMIAEIPETSTNLASTFISSINPFNENMRPNPFIGSSFSHLKLTDFILNDQPPIPIGVNNTITVNRTNKGAIIIRLSNAVSLNISISPLAFISCAFFIDKPR